MSNNGRPLLQQQDISFHRFKDLPNEIRDMIWKTVIQDVGPRLVYLRQSIKRYGRVWSDKSIRATTASGTPAFFQSGNDESESETSTDLNRGFYKYFTTICSIPAPLQARAESRRVCSRYYTMAFRTTKGSPYVWFRFSRDVIFLDFGWASGRTYSLGDVDPKHMRRVKHLAVPEREGSYSSYDIWLKKVLTLTVNLRTLKIVRGRLFQEMKVTSELVLQPVRTDQFSACFRHREPALVGFNRHYFAPGASLIARHDGALARQASFHRLAQLSFIRLVVFQFIKEANQESRRKRSKIKVEECVITTPALERVAELVFEPRSGFIWEHDPRSVVDGMNAWSRVRWTLRK